jgi:phosphoglycolate phosphatase-like HAD superfamily hydrolase
MIGAMQHHPNATFVLWDIDGTLVYNASTPGNLYHNAVERAVGRDLDPLVGHQHGRTDAGLIAEHLKAHQLDAGLRDKVSGHLQDLTAERHEAGDHRLMTVGTVALMARMVALGWHNCLLTGNSAFRAKLKLEGAGFDVSLFDWTHSFFGDEDVERSDLTARAAKELAGSVAVIIGDTPRDGEAAGAVGIPFVAVATGVYDIEALRVTNAVAVARDCAQDADVVVDAIASLAPLTI